MYRDPVNNAWLAQFAELSNEDKHEKLCTHAVDTTSCSTAWSSELKDGRRVLEVRTAVPGWLERSGGLILRQQAPGGPAIAYRFVFQVIGQEVGTFLSRALQGVKHIVETLKPDIS